MKAKTLDEIMHGIATGTLIAAPLVFSSSLLYTSKNEASGQYIMTYQGVNCMFAGFALTLVSQGASIYNIGRRMAQSTQNQIKK